MFTAVLMSMAMTGPAEINQCSAKASCATTQRVLVVRASCSTRAACSTAATCSRPSLIQRYHERRAEWHDNRAVNIGLRRGSLVIVELTPAPAPTPAKEPEKVPPPKKK
jgi:hypothetical protein